MISFNHPNNLKAKLYQFLGENFPLGILAKYKYYGDAHLLRWSSFLNKSQWFSKKQISRYQEECLKKIINHCYKNVPYYKGYLPKIPLKSANNYTLGALSEFPIITKDLVKQNQTNFTAANYKKYHPIECHTGGSTGKPLHFLHDKSVRGLVEALGLRFQQWAGQTLTHRFIMMRSAIGYREGKLDHTTPYHYDPIARMLEINTANLDQKHIIRALLLFAEFKPSFLHSYPSVANLLAGFILQNPKYKIRLKAVLVGSELLYPQMRKNIETAFDCRVFNFYGMEEAVTFAMQCEHDNMHLCPELGILEIIKDGKPCRPLEIGEFVCTGLHNFSMPLIRYTMNDCGYFKDIECPCGRKSPIIEVVGGRDKDLIVTKNGVINLLSHENISKKISGIKEFQIVQKNIGRLCVKIVKDQYYKEQDRNEIINGLKALVGDEVEIDTIFVTDIPRTNAGKFKFVLSNVKPEFMN